MDTTLIMNPPTKPRSGPAIMRRVEPRSGGADWLRAALPGWGMLLLLFLLIAWVC